MLNKKAAAIGGSSGAALVAVLLVFGTGTIMEAPTQADELPRVVGGGLPPSSKLTETAIGSEVPRFIDAEPVDPSQSERTANPEHSKYNGLLVLDGYEHLHVYKDQRGNKDVILGKVAVTPQLTGGETLYSGQYIWITINQHRSSNVTGDLYASLPLDPEYRLVTINDDVGNAPFKGMDQLVDFDGNNIAIRPSDLWFVTDDLSYTIRGHISLAESVRLANIVLSVEE